MEAHVQQKYHSLKRMDEKIYVRSENLHFGDEGIFWKVSQDKWLPISGVDHDA